VLRAEQRLHHRDIGTEPFLQRRRRTTRFEDADFEVHKVRVSIRADEVFPIGDADPGGYAFASLDSPGANFV
jgi:hypothetical protein